MQEILYYDVDIRIELQLPEFPSLRLRTLEQKAMIPDLFLYRVAKIFTL